MQLFELTKKIFQLNPKKFNELNGHLIKNHAFMINRFMSIKYPLIASEFNIKNMSGLNILKFWNIYCYNKHGGIVPGWLYTKPNKKTKIKPKNKKLKKSDIKKNIFIDFIPDKKTLVHYTNLIGCDLKDLEHYMKINENDMKKLLYHLEQSLIKNTEKQLN